MYKVSIKVHIFLYNCLHSWSWEQLYEWNLWIGHCRELAVPFIGICCGPGLRGTLWAGIRHGRPLLFSLRARKLGRILRLTKNPNLLLIAAKHNLLFFMQGHEKLALKIGSSTLTNFKSQSTQQMKPCCCIFWSTLKNCGKIAINILINENLAQHVQLFKFQNLPETNPWQQFCHFPTVHSKW